MCVALFFGLTLIATLTGYLAVPGLLWELEQQAPLAFEALGNPTEDALFSRQPSLMQCRFGWFVVRGKAYASTRGSGRTHAVLAWLGYVGVAAGMTGMLMCAPHR